MKAREHFKRCAECNGRNLAPGELYSCPECGAFHVDGAHISLRELGYTKAEWKRLRVEDERELARLVADLGPEKKHARRGAAGAAPRKQKRGHPWRVTVA